MTNILVTGANGFVGRHLVDRLLTEEGIYVRRACRRAQSQDDQCASVGDIDADTDWTKALIGIDAIVHCAARVHVMNGADSPQSLAAFRSVNVLGTECLARQAAAAGVRRLVFVSSVKVNGEKTSNSTCFSASGTPKPEDGYGRSKWEAEQILWQVAQETGLEVVIVRPPLVYGPGVKANFLRLMKAVRRNIPLPFGSVMNRRSMVYAGNLSDLITRCLLQQEAVGQTFMVSDGNDLSTSELIRKIAWAMGRRPFLIGIPPGAMRTVAKLMGKEEFAERLLGSLRVDISHTSKILGWSPPFSIEEGMKYTVRDFENRQS